jgi:Ni/Fe-hydrogenase subunit HybB-like protein
MGYSAVLAILLIDLGRFDRFYHFLIFWNPHSPLFEICWCVLLYTIVLVIESSPSVFERLRWDRALRWVTRAMVPVAIIGVTLSSLHQSTLGTLYLNMPHRLDPLWYSPVLPLLFLTSSVMAGLGLTVFAYSAATRIHGQKPEREVVGGLSTIAGWVTLLYVGMKLLDIAVAGELPAFFAFDRMSILMWIELGMGGILPVALLLVPAIRRHGVSQFFGTGLILLGVFLNRFNATLFAQSLPSSDGYSPHLIEWLIAVGIIAAALLAWYFGVRLMFRFKDHRITKGREK